MPLGGLLKIGEIPNFAWGGRVRVWIEVNRADETRGYSLRLLGPSLMDYWEVLVPPRTQGVWSDIVFERRAPWPLELSLVPQILVSNIWGDQPTSHFDSVRVTLQPRDLLGIGVPSELGGWDDDPFDLDERIPMPPVVLKTYGRQEFRNNLRRGIKGAGELVTAEVGRQGPLRLWLVTVNHKDARGIRTYSAGFDVSRELYSVSVFVELLRRLWALWAENGVDS